MRFAVTLGLLAGSAPAADSLNVRLIGSCDTPGNAYGVAASGSYTYVADWNSGLRVITVADPAHPAEVGSIDTPSHAAQVAVSGHYAYVADHSSGLHVISIFDPASPTEVGHCRTHGAMSVTLSGSYAFVGDSSGLRVISISDPTHPVEAGYCATTGYARDVAVQGDYAYAVDTFGLRVISISDPSHPAEVGQLYMPDYPLGVAVSGGYAYVADYGAGLRVISIADPAHPSEIGHLNIGGARKLVLDGDYAYGTAGWRVFVISVADPVHPSEVGYYVTQGQAFAVATSGGYIYVADDTLGLQICQFYGGGVEEGRQLTASSSRPTTTIVRGVLVLGAVDSKQHSAYRAELLDAAGRRVMELHQGANDVSGLVPGVYFVGGPMTDDGRLVAIRKIVVTR